MLQRVAERELDPDSIGRGPRQPGERLLVAGVAAAEEDELRVFLEQLAAGEDQVETFLLDQAAGHSKKRRVRSLGKAVGTLEGRLAAPLTLEVVRAVPGVDLRVGRWVPDLLVDPVEDADEPVAEREVRIVQAEAAARRAQLDGLAGADGNRAVGEGQPALQEVHFAVPFELPPVVQLHGQADLEHRFGAEMTLVPRVVHRHDGERVSCPGLVGEHRSQIDRGKRGVPVVGVDEDRTRGHPRQRETRGQREEREAAGVVRVVLPLLTVDAGAVEEIEMLDEEDPGAGRVPGDAEDAGLLDFGAQRHPDRRTDGLEVGRLVAHGAVERQDNRHGDALRLLERREAHHRLGKAAGARVGEILGRQVRDREGLAARRQQRCGARGLCGRRLPVMRWAGRRRTTRPGTRARSTSGHILPSSAGPRTALRRA